MSADNGNPPIFTLSVWFACKCRAVSFSSWPYKKMQNNGPYWRHSATWTNHFITKNVWIQWKKINLHIMHVSLHLIRPSLLFFSHTLLLSTVNFRQLNQGIISIECDLVLFVHPYILVLDTYKQLLCCGFFLQSYNFAHVI